MIKQKPIFFAAAAKKQHHFASNINFWCKIILRHFLHSLFANFCYSSSLFRINSFYSAHFSLSNCCVSRLFLSDSVRVINVLASNDIIFNFHNISIARVFLFFFLLFISPWHFLIEIKRIKTGEKRERRRSRKWNDNNTKSATKGPRSWFFLLVLLEI